MAHGAGGLAAHGGADAQGDQHLVGVQARGVVAEHVELHALHRLDDAAGDEIGLLRHPADALDGVEQRRGGGAEQVGGLAGDDPSVSQFDGHGRFCGRIRLDAGGDSAGAEIGIYTGLVHQQFDLVDFLLRSQRPAVIDLGPVIAADDLIAAGILSGLVVDDTVAGHVHAHVGR